MNEISEVAFMASILHGITNRDYRTIIADLMMEGWDAARTNGGHIKLVHNEAPSPIFASATPSDCRAGKNLIAQCRNARAGQVSVEIAKKCESDIDFEDIMRRKKKSTKAASRRQGQGGVPARVTAAPVLATATLPPQISNIPDSMKDMTSIATGTLPSAANTAAMPHVMPKPADKPLSPAKPTPEKKAVSKMPLDTATMTAPKAPTPEKPVTPAKVVAAAPAPVPAATHVVSQVPGAVGVIPGDIMALALRIAAGELQKMEITADMVGQTLFFDGTVTRVGAATAVPAHAATALVATPAPTPAPVVSTRGAAKRDALLASLTSLGGFVTVKDLAVLHIEEFGYRNLDSARASISQLLTKEAGQGTVVRGPADSLLSYRIA